MVTLEQLINYFNDVDGTPQYPGYIRAIDKANRHKTVEWIFDVVKKKGTLDDILKVYDNYFATHSCKWGQKTRENYRTGFKRFSEVVLGFYSANVWLSRGRGKTTDLFLCQLIADNAIFASASIVKKVQAGVLGSQGNKKNDYASWDYMTRARIIYDNGKKVTKGTPCLDQVIYPLICGKYPDVSKYVIADDNTFANQAIKKAVIASFNERYGAGIGTSMFSSFKDYEACHIWDKPGDRRYYASVANLVLIPRALAGLTDHNDIVKSLLRYEAYQRFSFIPDGEKPPTLDTKLQRIYSSITWHRCF